MTDHRTWGDLTTAERLELIRSGYFSTGKFTAEQEDAIMGRVAGYFLGRRDLDFYEATNALTRESWREEHDGDVSEWDAAARAAGQPVPTDPRAELLARKGEMTEDEFAAAEAKLFAPEPVRIGEVSWAGELMVGESPATASPYKVRVVWPTDKRTPDVFVDGVKARPKHRRRWLRLLAFEGVTRDTVIAAETSGRSGVLEG